MQMSARSTLGKGSRRPAQGSAVGLAASALDPRGMSGATSPADAHRNPLRLLHSCAEPWRSKGADYALSLKQPWFGEGWAELA